MAEDRPYRAETFSHAFDTSRQIDYQGCTPDSASGSGQRGSRSAFHAFKTHKLRNTRNDLFHDCKRGFGSDVAGRKSGTAGGDNDLEVIGARGPKTSFD